jgi:DNA-binding NtrC family response regulator
MRPTVLLVDDDPSLRDGLRRALFREPWEILVAGSGPEALRLLDRRPVDVVVSDQAMPEMSGLQFLSTVCQEHPDTIRIMLTGHGSLDLARRAINDGQVYRFFTKPCDPEDLKAAIRQGLEQRALLLESRRLLHTVRRQSCALSELEDEMKGLTTVTRDADGAIVLEEVPTDPVELLKEVQAELDAADERLRRREQTQRARGMTSLAGQPRREGQGS